MKVLTRIFYFILWIVISVPAVATVKKWSSSLPQRSIFKTESKLQKRIHFWVDIYSKYTTSQGVFHNVNKPELVYGEIDLSDIMNNSVLSESEKNRQIQKSILKQRKKILVMYRIKNQNSVRLQMGLKDRMQKAFYLSGKYLPMMEKVFQEKNIPTELTRIVFVESSFNILAQSKVGASGLWQIMPSVARAEGYMQKYYDKRNHPYYSTLLAANMLKQNYRSLKSWPLAITAYNHGLAGVRRMKAKVGSQDINKLIMSRRKTQSWGFASENFYPCFLAVLQVERNASNLYGVDLLQSKSLDVKNIYLKVATDKKTILKWYGGSMQKFKSYNPHLRLAQLKQQKYLPAGVPLVLPVSHKIL